MSQNTINPYVGPRTFTEEEQKFFFGRDREARDLLSLVVSERMVLFFAQSGAGKSSLLNARLIPYLVEKEGFVVLPVGRVSGELPQGIDAVDNIFVFNLLLSVDQSQRDPERFTNMTIKDFLANLTTTDGRSFFYAEPTSEVIEEGDFVEPPHILIIDQFEEILNTHLNRWEDRQGFFEQLNQAMVDDPQLWVVLTLREDYIAGLRPYASIMHNNMRARFYMKRMEADAGQQAIEMPAQLGNPPRKFDTGVAENLVNDLRQIRVQGVETTERGQFIEPVQLQVVCYQLWQNLEGNDSPTITQEEVDKLGNVDTALATFYEEAIAKAITETAVSEIELRNWFDHELITEAETRGTVYQGSEETAGMSNDVVRVLANQYLLRAEIRAGGTWYELVHDRFVSPIIQANQARRLRQSPLIRAAEEWNKKNKPAELLLLGDGLKQILATTDMATAEPLVRAYLEACQKAQDQLDLQKRVEEQAKLAEEERKKAEAQAETARKLRRLSVGLVVFVIIAVVAAFLAYGQATVATEQRGIAQEQQATAEAASTAAIDQQQIAETEKENADEQRATAESAQATAVSLQALAEQEAEIAQQEKDNAVAARNDAQEARTFAEQLQQESLAKSLAAQSFRINSLENNNQLAAQLAIEALKVHNALVAQEDIAVHDSSTTAGLSLIDSSIRESLSGYAFTSLLFNTRDEIIGAALHPNGQVLAVATALDGIVLFDLTHPELPPQFLAPFFNDNIHFSDDGSVIITTGASGIQLLDTETGAELYNDFDSYIYTDALRSGERPFLITLNENFDIQALDFNQAIAGDEPTPSTITNQKRDDYYLGISPNGNLLATGSFSTINLWDLTRPGGSLILTLTDLGNAEIDSVTFTPDNTLIATADTAGTIRIWDLADIQNGGPPTPTRLTDDGTAVTSMIFSPDLTEFVSGHQDGTIRIWNWEETDFPEHLVGHNGAIKFLGFDNTNDILLSAGADNTVRHWNLGSERANVILRYGDNFVHSATAISPDGRFTAISTDNGTTELQDIFSPESPPINFRPSDTRLSEPYHLKFSPDGSKLASVHWNPSSGSATDALIYIWDVNAPQTPPIIINSGLDEISALTFHPDNQHLAIAAWGDTNAYIWDTTEVGSEPIIIVTEAEDPDEIGIQTMAFNSDGQQLATAVIGDILQIWDDPLGNAQLATELQSPISEEEFQPWASDIAFAPDDSYIILGADHGKAVLWQIDDPTLSPLTIDTDTTFRNVYITVSPDGSHLTTSTGDSNLLLWNINEQIEEALVAPVELSGHTAPVYHTTFIENGDQLLSLSEDGEVRQWSVDLNDLIEEVCHLILRPLDENEWMRYHETTTNQDYAPTCPVDID